METELINIFNDDLQPIGTATREEVHTKGYWHETFHCWIISEEEGKVFVHLQIRSATKKDYPNLLDITAAGHILAHETTEDGIREVKEELGIDVNMNQLKSIGVIKYHVEHDGFIDKELAHVYLYKNNLNLEDYKVQIEEVSGVGKVEFSDFSELWLGEKEEIFMQGFEMDIAGKRMDVNKLVNKSHFVPHEDSYFEKIIEFIKNEI